VLQAPPWHTRRGLGHRFASGAHIIIRLTKELAVPAS